MSEEHNANESAETHGSNNSINRRRFVKSLGIAGGAAAVSIPGNAAAKSQKPSNLKYDSSEKIEEEIRAYGSDVLAFLAKEEVISDSSVAKFNTNITGVGKVISGEKGVGVLPQSDKVETTQILANKRTSSGLVVLCVEPEKERGFAYQQLNSGSEVRFYNPEIGKPFTVEKSELHNSKPRSTVEISTVDGENVSVQEILKNCYCTRFKCAYTRQENCDLCAFGHCLPYLNSSSWILHARQLSKSIPIV